MSFKVSFTDRAGKLSAVILPTLTLATQYAKGVKNPTIQETEIHSTHIEVKVGKPVSDAMQRSIAKAYHSAARKGNSAPTVISKEAKEYSSENRDELMAEHFGRAQANGQCQEDAWNDWDHRMTRCR